jgi:hypothetical protein
MWSALKAGGSSSYSYYLTHKEKPPTPLYPLERNLIGPQRYSGHGSDEKNSISLSGPEPYLSSPMTL